MALGILIGLLRGRLIPRKGLTALTTKRGPKKFYEGKGCKSTGWHTNKAIDARINCPESFSKYIYNFKELLEEDVEHKDYHVVEGMPRYFQNALRSRDIDERLVLGFLEA